MEEVEFEQRLKVLKAESELKKRVRRGLGLSLGI